MQAEQSQKLTRLIKESPVLRNDERAAWLAMLPVMNDKQAADLFGILQSKPGPVKASLEAKASFVIPPLRHITNLPTGMPLEETRPPVTPRPLQNTQVIANKPAAKIPIKKLSVLETLKAQVAEKELPAGHEPLELVSGQVKKSDLHLQNRSPSFEDTELEQMRQKVVEPKTQPAVSPMLSHKPAEFIPLDDLLSDQKLRHEKSEPMPLEPRPGAGSDEKLSVDSSVNLPKELKDIAGLEVGTLRQAGFDSLKQRLVLAVRHDGFFAVQFELEKSPLYQAYIHSGQIWLSGKTDQQTRLSKQEFEQVTDLLRALQVSQTA